MKGGGRGREGWGGVGRGGEGWGGVGRGGEGWGGVGRGGEGWGGVGRGGEGWGNKVTFSELFIIRKYFKTAIEVCTRMKSNVPLRNFLFILFYHLNVRSECK